MWKLVPSLPPTLPSVILPAPITPPGALLSEAVGFSVPWPKGLKEDQAVLRRIANLIEPCDFAGRRGSYAGWITRHALSAAANRADEQSLASLLIFFQKGGSIRELESIAARILPLDPPGGSGSFFGELWSLISPLQGWRAHRRSMMLTSKDPMCGIRLKELEDRNLRLIANPSSPLGRGQKSAYLKDAEVSRLMDTVENEASFLLDGRKIARRYEETRKAIGGILPDARKPYDLLWAPQVRGALKLLGDDRSVAAADRMQREYSIYPLTRGKFEEKVRERHRLEGVSMFKDPTTQRAVYFKKSAKKGAEMFLQSHPLDLPWNLEAADVFFEVLATAIHEDDHHAMLQSRPYEGSRPEQFAFEVHGHGVEYLWRALHGDAGLLRSLTAENPLGFALAFLDYFEENY